MTPNIASTVPQTKKNALQRKEPADPEEMKMVPSERNRYLDLFTQLNIIEDSFEFVHFIFHFDPFQCVYAGSTFEKIYGYSCKDIYNRTELFYEVAHPDDAAFLMQQIKVLLKDGYHEFTYRIITKAGEVKHLKVNAWYQQDEGHSYVMNCFQKDVTGQMETKNSLRKSLQKHQYISDIAIALNLPDDFEQKLQMVVDKIGASVQADQVSLYEIDTEKKHMECRYIWTKQEVVVPQGILVRIPPLNNLPDYISTLQFSAGETPDGFMRHWKLLAQVQSLMLIPIRIKHNMFGFIELISTGKRRKWRDDDLSFVGTIGNMTANFYDRKTINDELNQNYLNQEILANVSYRLNKYTDDKEHVLKGVLEYIGMKKPSSERIFIFRYDVDDRQFRKTNEYVNPSLSPKYSALDEYDSVLFTNVLLMLESGKPYCVSDVAQFKPEIRQIFNKIGVKSLLITPLFVDGQLYGVYGYSYYTHFHAWNKNEIEIAQAFADTISHFIERQTIMKRLKDSEKKFKDISAKLPGCVFQATLSPTEDITLDYISPQFEQWTGTKAISKTSLRKIQQSIHPNDHDAFFRVKKELERFNTEISFEGRFYFTAIGFKWLIVKITMSEVKTSGEIIYNGLFIDITENKQTELKLADANISIQSIINNLESGVLLVDDYNNVLYSNEKLEEMLDLELDAENEQSQILEATFNMVRDSDSLKNQTKDLMRKRIEERGRELFFNRTAEFVTRDYIPVFRDHRFFAHLFIFNNVTHGKLQELEVQKSYKRVRTIIDYSDIGVVLLSENEKVMTVNDKFLRMYQIKEPASYFVNQLFRVLWDKMVENVHIEGLSRELIRDVVYSGKRIVNQEITINEISTLQCFIEPVLYDSQLKKDIHETLIQMVDVTLQKNIEQTLRKAKEEAETMAKAKSHILTSMSHEIRTPLNGILGFSSMLKESLTDPYQREMAEVIDQSGHRLLETMNAILDFSVVQSEKKSYKITSVNLNHILQEQIKTHRNVAMQKGLYLYAEIKGRISLAIAERVLYKILYNLINNAIKYTITGGVKIEAGITYIEGNDWLELKVIDTGVGIDEIKHKTIFEPFRQESEGYGRAFEGAGLGLSLVKEYVQRMNGLIRLASRKDEGSTFTVLLPNVYYENSDTSLETIGIPPDFQDD